MAISISKKLLLEFIVRDIFGAFAWCTKGITQLTG